MNNLSARNIAIYKVAIGRRSVVISVILQHITSQSPPLVYNTEKNASGGEALIFLIFEFRSIHGVSLS